MGMQMSKFCLSQRHKLQVKKFTWTYKQQQELSNSGRVSTFLWVSVAIPQRNSLHKWKRGLSKREEEEERKNTSVALLAMVCDVKRGALTICSLLCFSIHGAILNPHFYFFFFFDISQMKQAHLWKGGIVDWQVKRILAHLDLAAGPSIPL